MKAQAQTDPMTCYRLAQAFPNNSESYLQLMSRAAELGLTNAMFDLALLSLKGRHPEGQAKALAYLQGIFSSDDTFMKSQAQELLAKYPDLLAQFRRHSTEVTNPNRFFKPQEAPTDSSPGSSNKPN